MQRDRSPSYYKNNYERKYYHTFQDHRNRRKYKKSYKDKHREENHKYKRRSRDYYVDFYEDRYNRDEYEYQYRDERCCMPPHFQVQSMFMNHCDTYMVIHPCMIKNEDKSVVR